MGVTLALKIRGATLDLCAGQAGACGISPCYKSATRPLARSKYLFGQFVLLTSVHSIMGATATFRSIERLVFQAFLHFFSRFLRSSVYRLFLRILLRSSVDGDRVPIVVYES